MVLSLVRRSSLALPWLLFWHVQHIETDLTKGVTRRLGYMFLIWQRCFSEQTSSHSRLCKLTHNWGKLFETAGTSVECVRISRRPLVCKLNLIMHMADWLIQATHKGNLSPCVRGHGTQRYHVSWRTQGSARTCYTMRSEMGQKRDLLLRGFSCNPKKRTE